MKKVRKLKTWLLLLVVINLQMVVAQQPQWYIKNTKDNVPLGSTSRIIDFTGSQTNVSTTGTLLTDHGAYEIYYEKEADNAIYDESGNLEIFIAHDEVFNSSGDNINRLVKSSYNFFSNPSQILNDYDLAICRVPLSCTKYYIFRYSMDVAAYKLDYYIYDISTHAFEDANGVQFPQINSNNDGLVPGIDVHGPQGVGSAGTVANVNLSISKLNNTNERFLIFDNEFGVSIAKISSTGVTYSSYPVSSNHTSEYLFPRTFSNPLGTTFVCETEIIQLSDGTYRVTRTSTTFGGSTKIYIIHLDNNGLINSSNPYDVYSSASHVKGLEFSPNGQYLYITRTAAPYLVYVDITSQLNSVTTLDLPPTYNNNGYKENFKIGSIEMGHDGKMYFAGVSGISSYSDPNNPTNAIIPANWIDNDIPVVADWLIARDPNGNPYQTEAHLIPLPEQVDGELLYTPITPGTFIGCGNVIPAGCVEDYPGFDYKWYSGLNQVGSGACFTPTSYGNYELVVTDENKCEKTYRIKFENDFPYIPELNDIVHCSLNESPELLGWNVDGEYSFMSSATAINWTFNGDPIQTGPIDFQIPFMSYGTYSATVYTLCGAQTISFTVSDQLVEYIGHPFANVTATQAGLNVIFSRTNLFPGPFAYEWLVTKNNVSFPISYLNSVSYSYTVGDVFNVQLILKDNINCRTYRRTILWSPTTKVSTKKSSFESEFSIDVYPNPVVKISNISLMNMTTEWYSLQIMDLDGKIVSEKEIQNNFEINFSELSKGAYLIRVFNDFESDAKKIIVN